MDATLGNLFALTGAFVWAVSSLLFARTRVAPFALNTGKNVIAAVALTATLAVITWRSGHALVTADASTILLLAASSFVGLVLGDTFHFRALRMIGARKALVLETLAPVFAALLAFAFASERIGAREILGIAVTLAGVAVVVGDEHGVEHRVDARTRWIGSFYGALAALGQAGGATLAKRAIVALEAGPAGSSDAALEAAMLRLWSAVVFGAVVVAISRARRREAAQVLEPRELRWVVPAALLATYIGVWLSLAAFQHTTVAVASTLLALSPVIVLPLSRVLYREPITVRALGGAVLAVAGVALLFVGA